MPYKQKSDSYLMTLTKAQIIEELRAAEHNFAATEEALNNSIAAGKAIYDENQKAKELLEEALKIMNGVTCSLPCNKCLHILNSHCTDKRNKFIWDRTGEAIELITKEEIQWS